MSNEEHNEEQFEGTSTVLVHIEDAADTIGSVIEKYSNGEITQEEMVNQANAALPKLEDVGYSYEEDSDVAYINTKPVPENALASVYFYRDESDTLKMTVRLHQYGDNEKVTDADGTVGIEEMAAFEILRLVNMEHQSILEKVMMAQMFSGILEQAEAEGDEDDPLAAIEDESTKDQVRKMMKH